MALHLNLLHEEILEHRQRQRDPLKIGVMVLVSFGVLMFLYYMWNAYRTLEIKGRLSVVEREWAKVEFKALEDLDTIVNVSGTNLAMARYTLTVGFNAGAAAKTAAASPSPRPARGPKQ